MLIDSHAHLDSLEELPEVLNRARENGVQRIISISSGISSSKKTLDIARSEKGVYAALGVHPHNAAEAGKEVISEIDALLNEPEVVAVGETGLDYFYMNSDKEAQVKSFKNHIALGLKHGLSVIIHVRDADKDLEDILRTEDVSSKTGVIHCFTGNYEQAKIYLDLGFYISFSGIVTFKRSDENREAARNVPADRILVETDSPYLAPVPHRGKPNEPAYVRNVADVVAGVRGIAVEELAEITSANARRLFNLGD